jgi:hypothetical protein
MGNYLGTTSTLMFSLTCNCGLTIAANTEKGLRKLVIKHNNDGEIHQCWKAFYDIKEETILQSMLKLGKIFDDSQAN